MACSAVRGAGILDDNASDIIVQLARNRPAPPRWMALRSARSAARTEYIGAFTDTIGNFMERRKHHVPESEKRTQCDQNTRCTTAPSTRPHIFAHSAFAQLAKISVQIGFCMQPGPSARAQSSPRPSQKHHTQISPARPFHNTQPTPARPAGLDHFFPCSLSVHLAPAGDHSATGEKTGKNSILW